VDTSNRTDEQMSCVFISSFLRGRLIEPIQAYQRTSSSPLEPHHGIPLPLQFLLSFPSLHTPTPPNNLSPICEKGELRRQCLSYPEAVLPVASYHLSRNNGPHLSFPSCSSSSKETTEQTHSCSLPWSLNCLIRSPRGTGQARWDGSNQRAGMVACLGRRMTRPFMADLGQSAGFSSILV
jgi:hypothetical protein